MIQVTVFKKTADTLEAQTQRLLKNLSEEQTKLLANEHKEELIKAINETRVRPLETDREKSIEKNIEVEKIDGGYGVGNIDTLNKKAKHWAWINYGMAFSGRTTPPTDFGSFDNMPEPITGAKGGKWQHLKHSIGGRLYQLTPKKAIQAHNYIEKALAKMLSRVRTLLKGNV
jgi:hypothetical protein